MSSPAITLPMPITLLQKAWLVQKYGISSKPKPKLALALFLASVAALTEKDIKAI